MSQKKFSATATPPSPNRTTSIDAIAKSNPGRAADKLIRCTEASLHTRTLGRRNAVGGKKYVRRSRRGKEVEEGKKEVGEKLLDLTPCGKRYARPNRSALLASERRIP